MSGVRRRHDVCPSRRGRRTAIDLHELRVFVAFASDLVRVLTKS